MRCSGCFLSRVICFRVAVEEPGQVIWEGLWAVDLIKLRVLGFVSILSDALDLSGALDCRLKPARLNRDDTAQEVQSD
jgi:hypothetical protein